MKLAKLLVSVGVISVLAGCGENDTARTHIEKAKSFKSTEIDSILIELKNAVKIEPKNGEARFLLGEAYLSQGFGVGAVKELQKAYDFKYDENKLIPLLARAYLLTTADEDLLDLDKHTANLIDDTKVHYLAYKTLAAIRTNNMELASESVESANKLLPNNTYTLLANAYLEMAENKLELAKGHVNKALAISPTQVDSLLLLGQISTALGEHKEATESYLKYAKLQPKSNVIVLFLAQSLLKEEKFLEAERYADSILSAAPNQPFANYVKAMSQFELKNYQKAKEYAETALKSQFNQGPLKLIAGVSAYFLGNYEQSHYHLESVVKYLVPEHPARKMFAVSQLQLGMVEDIPETLEGFHSTTAEDEKFLSSLSYQLAELGAFDNAKAVAKKALNSAPEGAEQNMRDGILKLMLNDPSGMQNLKDAVALQPDFLGAELALAYAAIQAKDYEQAITISEKWKEKYPEKPGGYNVLAAVYLKQGAIEKAKVELDKSLAIQNSVFALLELTNLAIIAKDVDEAKRLSGIAIDSFPENVNILRQYYSVFNNEEAFDKIKELYKSDEKNQTIGMLYTELLIKAKKFNEAINVIDKYETTVKTPKKLWQLKVLSHSGLNNVHKSQTVLEDWIKTNPYHIEPVVMLADYFARSNNIENAINLIDKALRGQHADNDMLKMGKMQLLLDNKDVREAKAYYQELKKEGIKSEITYGIEGRIALLSEDYANATLLLSKFYDAFPSSKNAILLAGAYQGHRENNKAITLLEKHLAKNDSDNAVRAILASIYVTVDPNKAIASYKKILQQYPGNVMVLNNVAWLTMEQGNFEEALTYSEEAYKLAPEFVNVIDTQAMILLKMDKKSEALSLLVKAYELSEGKNNDVTLNYIEVLIANKRLKKAEQIIESITLLTSGQKQRVAELKKRL
ncbi:XrtA/PEP-CTERM system TPR-repeat protein PrsT [Pseudocolwellia agarivorans]|uniref:XrtA/PEP-CTERM system TPR-repeat protein PrsT n=1 Tax=Pseudocolwellia agarivorans TaxID=1911682 RepID=UPI0009851A22|nr:XrtA/PEP-CTERM system TPR-repeat protein PrsT [Pseudocolwellia agarivorans]